MKGSIARSPPLLAKVDFPEYVIHVEQIARKVYPRCIKDLERKLSEVKRTAQNDPEEFLRSLKITVVSHAFTPLLYNTYWNPHF